MALCSLLAPVAFSLGSWAGVASFHPVARPLHARLTPLRASLTSQHAEADAFFAAIDDDGDGYISFVELTEHLEGLGFNPGAIDHVFDMLDVNRDGDISQDEMRDSFAKYDDPVLRIALGLGLKESDAIFSAIDTNGDGEISMAELTAYLSQKGYVEGGGDVVGSIFRTLDANSDGSISRAELRQGYSEYAEIREALGLAP